VASPHFNPDEQTPGRRKSPRVEPAVGALIRRPYLAEILAALDQRPHTLASLRRTTGAPRRPAVAVLRALASHQAIIRHSGTGSWDTIGGRQVRYQLTTAGHALINQLFDVDVWRAAYESPPTQP
jgi:DNA-binding HxlR family transcriptional regulator